jgi:glutamate/tyrosine decarboxylase-like PLP-dependent enzyme
MTHLGAEGYLRLARRVLDATTTFRKGIEAIDGLRVTSDPDMSVFEFGAEPDSGIDIDAVCDVMDDRGWNLDRQQGGLHIMASPGHDKVAAEFVEQLGQAVANHGTARGGEHVYGGVVD